MVLLIGFAFLAGAGTAISPCVLPVLPVVLSASATGGRRRPLGIVTGLALSFTFATVALVYVIDALGLPSGLPRTLAIVVLIVFGVALLVPPLAARVEARLSRLTGAIGSRSRRPGGEGFGAGLLVGASLGLVYAPCAGPILAGVITVSAAQSFTAGRLAVALAYGIGSAVVLYVLALGGRRLSGRLARRSGWLQMAMGAVMVVVAIAMLENLDTRFETAIASDIPSFLVDPTKSLESSNAAQKALVHVRGRIGGGSGQVAREAGASEAARGVHLPVLGTAPDLVGLGRWFNTPGDRPVTLRQLRGRVVLVDFWTYSCINCIRTLPYLKAWDARYRSKGLTIVGVHTPEFPFEHDASNVQAAIAQDGLHYPVAQDNYYRTWNAYHNEYWPAEYLIDARGRLRLVEFGEGNYAGKERAIRSLLAEAGAARLGGETRVSAQAPPGDATTPESYLGSDRAERFVNGSITSGLHHYSASAATPSNNELSYGGTWQISSPAATAGPGAQLKLSFDARRVFLVLGSPQRARQVRVLLDGRPIPASDAGSDVSSGVLTVREQRLYTLVSMPRVETHVLTLLPAPGVTGYAFTFG
jgi:cytochrome c biogenesis protein CcdA/thiol-disulfide isomerase/thioredoxin